MIKILSLIDSIIAGGMIGYNYLKYINAPEESVIKDVEVDYSNPKIFINLCYN